MTLDYLKLYAVIVNEFIHAIMLRSPKSSWQFHKRNNAQMGNMGIKFQLEAATYH